MPSEFIETHEMELSKIALEGPDLEALDERFLDLYRVVVATEVTLEATQRKLDVNTLAEQEYVSELFQAHQTGIGVLQRDDLEEIAEDLSRLDEATLSDLRSSVAYVAPHFGIDLELPAPDSANSSDERMR